MNPDYVSPELGFLSSIEYSLRWLKWAKTKDGSAGRNVPQPISLLPEKKTGIEAEDFVAMTPDEMDAFLGRSFRN